MIPNHYFLKTEDASVIAWQHWAQYCHKGHLRSNFDTRQHASCPTCGGKFFPAWESMVQVKLKNGTELRATVCIGDLQYGKKNVGKPVACVSKIVKSSDGYGNPISIPTSRCTGHTTREKAARACAKMFLKALREVLFPELQKPMNGKGAQRLTATRARVGRGTASSSPSRSSPRASPS